MRKGKKEFQDIYHAPKRPVKDSDGTHKMPPEWNLQLRQYRIRIVFFGTSSVVLLFFIAVLLLRGTRIKHTASTRSSVEHQYVPYHGLHADDLWVMVYQKAAKKVTVEGESGNKPLSTKWVKNVAYHVIVGQQALTINQYDKAAIHFEKALKIFPTLHGVRGSLGTVYLKQKKFEDAINLLKDSLQEETSFSAISNLGAALLAAQRLEEAEQYLRQALAMQLDHPGCHKNLALLYQKMGTTEKALHHFEKYFSLNRGDLESTELYVEYLLRLDQREHAITFLKESCQQQNEKALPLYLQLAKMEAESTNSVQAVDALKRITEYISPNLALTQLHMENFDTIRDTEAFQKLLHQLELSVVTLEDKN